MLKSKWARLAVLSVLGMTLPVLAAVNKSMSHGKVAMATKSQVTKTTTPAAKSSIKTLSAKSSAKPKAVAHKKLTTKKVVRKSVKPLHTKTAAKSSALSLKKNTKSTKLSAKKQVTHNITKSAPKTLSTRKSTKASTAKTY